MRFTRYAALLSLGAGAYSMLVVPDVEVNQEPSTTPETLAIAQLTQTLSIECESCPFVTGKDSKGVKTFSQTPNNLQLTLSLDPNARDTISLNNKPLFPFIYTLDPSDPKSLEPFTVIQKAVGSDDQHEVPIGLDLFIETDEHNISRLRLHVLTVNGFKTLATMDILEFPIFQNEKGEIFIGEVHVRGPTPAEASSVMCKDNMLCRWKAYLWDTFHRVTGTGGGNGRHGRPKGKGKGCHGGRRKFQRPPHGVGHEQPHNYQGAPVDADRIPHNHHHHGQQQEEMESGWYYWVILVAQLFITLVVVSGVILGLGFGITIALAFLVHVGLFVFWFFKGGKRPSARCGRFKLCRSLPESAPKEDGDEEEAKGLMSKDEESQLDSVVPEYSDELPLYTENAEKH